MLRIRSKRISTALTVTAAGDVVVSATESANIQALTIGGAIAAGVGSDGGVGVAGAGAGSQNTVANVIQAYIQDGAAVAAQGGTVTLSAVDNSTVTANGGGIGIAVGFGESAGLARRSEFLRPTMISKTRSCRSSIIRPSVRWPTQEGPVTLSATEAATIQALTIAGAGGVGAGEAGVGVGARGPVPVIRLKTASRHTSKTEQPSRPAAAMSRSRLRITPGLRPTAAASALASPEALRQEWPRRSASAMPRTTLKTRSNRSSIARASLPRLA